MKSPLPIVALLYTGGVVAGSIVPVINLSWLFGLSFILLLLALGWASRREWILALFLPLAGYTNLVTRTAVLSPQDLRRLVRDAAEYLTVRGTISEAPVYREYERNARLIGHTVTELRVSALRRDQDWQPAFGNVVVTVPGKLDDRYFAGQEVEITGVLQRPRGPTAPGQFDYRAYLKWRSVFHLLRSETTNDWRRVGAFPSDRRRPWTDRFTAWAQRTLAQGSPQEDEPLRLLWAMVLGWKTALTQEVAEPFMESGTLHVFAISGLHIALIAGILINLLRVVRIPRGACGLVVIPVIWFYTLATGWQASAIRSTIMMTIIIVGWALARPSDLINSLAAAAFVILVWDPRQLFQAGFQLSFFVVLGLALIVPPLERIRRRLLQPDPLLPPELRPAWKRWLDPLVRLVTTSFATSLAAWLGSLPLIAYYFYMVTPGSLLANLLIVPLSSIALMSSLGSLVCGAWFSSITELFNHCSWFAMELMIWLSRWFADMPGGYFHVRPPSLIEFVAYYIFLGGVLSGLFLKPRWRPWAVAVYSLLLGVWAVQGFLERSQVHLTVLPMQSGTVFIDAAGWSRDLLVDCGDAVTGESMVKPFLRSQGVNRFATLLLSHGDLAHVGGMEPISSRFRIGKIVTGLVRSRSPAYRQLLARLEQNPEQWRRVQRGDQVHGWAVLHPSSEDRFTKASDNVIVLRGTLCGTSVLLLSDLGRLGQRKLLERETNLHADILIASLSSQTEAISEALLEAVKPRLLVVACVDYPSANRPSGQLRDRLARLNIPIVYTSGTGAAVLMFRSNGWRLRTMDGRQASPDNLVSYLPAKPATNDSNEANTGVSGSDSE